MQYRSAAAGIGGQQQMQAVSHLQVL